MKKKRVKLLLVDDHSVVRQGLKLVLDLHEEIEVCAEAGTLGEAMELIPQKKPDVVLLDFKLTDGDGVIGCMSIKKLLPQVKVIILTAYAEEHIIKEAIRVGADGYLLKNIESEELAKNIISVYNGNSVLDERLVNKVFHDTKSMATNSGLNSKLSPRETEILRMVSLGKANKEIAEDLDIADKTVRNYVSIIFRKINVSNRTEAASYLLRREILDKD